MKRITGFTLALILVSSAVVTSQPFDATITLLPGCNLQYSYGQKVCGQIYVSHDAWVTRWVEDQYGHTWYHWGTRYYTAGQHTFCGYMGLPIGEHIMKIHAIRVSDSAEATDQCSYTVCCGYSVWIPDRPSCNCEDVQFTAEVDKTQVTPGDTITVTVSAINDMGGDCRKKFDAGHLEIDWGILGGNTSPLRDDILVRAGESKTILEEVHIIPPVSEGDYSIVIYYSDAECTWIDYATLSVVLPTGGSFEILSYPELMNVDERGRIRVLVRNQSQKETSFSLLIRAPEAIYLPSTLYRATIPRAGYQEINAEFQPREEGTHLIELELISEEKTLGHAAVSIKVEKPLLGTIEVISPPARVSPGESTSLRLRITNPGQYDTAYTISATGTDVQTPAIPELFVPASQSREAEIFLTPEKEGVHQVVFQLRAQDQLLDSKTTVVEAERKPSFLPVMALLAGGLVLVLVIGYIVLKKR